MTPSAKGVLWLRWVVANALGEMFGLGLTLSVGGLVISSLEIQNPVEMILLTFIIAVASGVFEATLVGLAQWWVMQAWFPHITRPAWWRATLIGALIAYVMGYIPSTLMDLGEQAAQPQAAMAEPGLGLVLLLAAALGAAGGAVLSFAQYLVMRGKVQGAAIWIPGNMLAWLVGMPIIFWGIDFAQKLAELEWAVLFMAGILLLAGWVVGSIHGLFLVRLAGGQSRISPGAVV